MKSRSRTPLRVIVATTRSKRQSEGVMEQIAPIRRRLAAVAFADVAGWARLIEQNDVETVRAWRTLRTDLIEPKAQEHGGRLLEVAGDAVLLEFPARWPRSPGPSTPSAPYPSPKRASIRASPSALESTSRTSLWTRTS